jgi:hypothetical protein
MYLAALHVAWTEASGGDLCGFLATDKSTQGRRRQDRANGAWRGSRPTTEMAATEAGGGVAIRLRRMKVGKEEVFLGTFGLRATVRYARVGEEEDMRGRHAKTKFRLYLRHCEKGAYFVADH